MLRKLEASLAAGQFYEAHEMFKTVYYRLRARRQAEESYALCQVRLGCCVAVGAAQPRALRRGQRWVPRLAATAAGRPGACRAENMRPGAQVPGSRASAQRSLARCPPSSQEGARLQLTRGQLNCGVELCMLLVEAYEADQLPPSDASVGRLLSLLDAYPRGLAGAAAGQQAGDVAAASAAAGGGGGSGSGSGSGGSDPPLQEASKFAAAAVKWLRG